MQFPPNKADFERNIPCFENIEERLLLTTLKGGEYFIYYNSQEQAVRIDLNGSPTDTIELLSRSSTSSTGIGPFEIMDLVGIYNGDIYDRVDWPDETSIIDFSSDEPAWMTQEGRAASTEIFAIYVASCSSETAITISTLESTSLTSSNWDSNLNTWSSQAVLAWTGLKGDEEINAPDASGGVLVGATQITGTASNLIRYEATATPETSIVPSPNWVYPGTEKAGPLYPGVTINEQAFTLVGTDLGTEVTTLAADTLGQFYYTQEARLRAEVISGGTGLGKEILGLAVNSSNQMYGVDSYFPHFLLPPEVESLTEDQELGDSQVKSLAILDDGRIFASDGTNVFQVDPQTGAPSGNLYPLLLGENPWWTFANIADLKVDPSTGYLYAVATLTNNDPQANPGVTVPAGPYIVMIDPDYLTVNTAASPTVVGMTVTGYGRFMDSLDRQVVIGRIAFDSQGNLYGLNPGGTGIYQISGGLSALVTVPPIGISPATALTGITFIGDQLYGVSRNGLYLIGTPDAGATLLYETWSIGLNNLRGLAYNKNYKNGVLWSICTDETEGISAYLLGLPLSARLQLVDKTDGGAEMIDLIGDDDYAYRDIRALDFGPDPANPSQQLLYAVAVAVPLDPVNTPATTEKQVLITINTDTAAPTLIAELDVEDIEVFIASITGKEPADVNAYVESLAFRDDGTLYGIVSDSGKNVLVSIVYDPGDPQVGYVSLEGQIVEDGTGLYLGDLTGLQFMPLGDDDGLYAIGQDGDVWTIDIDDVRGTADIDATLLATGTQLLGDTDVSSTDSLAFDSSLPGVLWATGGENLLRFGLGGLLGATDQLGQISFYGALLGSDGLGWIDFRALDFGPDGSLYGIASNLILTPYITGSMDVSDPYLVEINVIDGTAVVESVMALEYSGAALTGALSIAVHEDVLYLISAEGAQDVLYAFDTDLTSLQQVAVITGLEAGERVSSFDSLVFLSGSDPILYAVTIRDDDTSHIYQLDPQTGEATYVSDTGLEELESLTGYFDPAKDQGLLWSISLLTGVPRLVSIIPAPATELDLHSRDLGKLFVGGTVSGKIVNGTLENFQTPTGGNIDLIYIGFLWGKIEVGANVGDIIIRQGGGAVLYESQGEEDLLEPDDGSHIWIGKTLRSLHSTGAENGLHVGVRVENDLNRDLPDDVIYERELSVDSSAWSDLLKDQAWSMGYMVDYTNDTAQTAQFVSHPTGSFVIKGTLYGYNAVAINDRGAIIPSLDPTSDDHSVFGEDAQTDWYAMPLLAGQTVRIEAELFSMVSGQMGLAILDSDLRFMDTFGWETSEDYGLGSAGETLKPIIFTAPSAGIYYIVVTAPIHPNEYQGGDYNIHVTNGPSQAFGAARMGGDHGFIISEAEGVDYWIPENSFEMPILDPVKGEQWFYGLCFAANYGGGIGAIVIEGRSYGTYVHSFGNGDIAVYQAGTVGGFIDSESRFNFFQDRIFSQGHIGKLASTNIEAPEGFMNIDARAGTTLGYTLNNSDKHIQYVFTATNTGSRSVDSSSIAASGSIGVIEVLGTLGDIKIQANSDNIGPAGKIDLIWCNNFGGPQLEIERIAVPPGIWTGPGGGDVAFIYVQNEIYVRQGNGSVQASPVRVTNGRPTRLTDDGGGQALITPVETMLLDENGQLIVVNGMPVTYIPSYEYIVIGINGDHQGGTGGVIARLNVDGDVTVSTGSGQVVQVGDLNISGWMGEDPNRPTSARVVLGGSGKVDVYHAHDGTAQEKYQTVELVVRGDLTSARFTKDISTLNVDGNLGSTVGRATKQHIFGNNAAPVSANVVIEPQYGWYKGRINGLWADGDVDLVTAKGAIRDVRVGGELGEVRANSDNLSPTGQWDGINGIVWSATRIGKVYVGDGLADDGGAAIAQAAVMSSGSIGGVYITGPYREIYPQPTADINVLLRGRMYYGLLNGAIIGLSNEIISLFDEEGLPILDDQGLLLVDVLGELDELGRLTIHGVNKVIGTKGAVNTALILGMGLDSFHCYKPSLPDFSGFLATSGIGTVSFSDTGAEIDGSEIHGTYIRKVHTSIDSNGISYSYIVGDAADANHPAIGYVEAGGPGMFNTEIRAIGSFGTITGLGTSADFAGNRFISTGGATTFSARHMYNNGWHIPGVIGSIVATGDMYDNGPDEEFTDVGGFVGSIRKLEVGGDFLRNDFRIAGELTNMTVGGRFDSTITMYGPTLSNLNMMIVTGDIAGYITSYGRIGTIISRRGVITADIRTIGDNGDIQRIQTAGGYTGNLDISGSLDVFISDASLGENPEDMQSLFFQPRSQTFSIGGSLGVLKVLNGGNLYANLYVGGDIGSIDVAGTFYGDIVTYGSLGSLTLGGGFGGQLNIDGSLVDMGSLTVMGAINRMKFNTAADMVADLTVGGSLERIELRNANIRGDLTSVYGKFGLIRVNGGSILGDVSASSIGQIDVRGGGIGATGTPVTVTATEGGVKSIKVSGGNLNADIDVYGRIDLLQLAGGNMPNGRTIQARGGFGSVDLRSGNLDADLLSGRDIARLYVRSGNLGGLVSAETDIDRLEVSGAITGSVRAAGKINKLTAGSLAGATISSGWNMDTVRVNANVTNSLILAGYDVGPDGQVGGGDDNPISASVHGGSIKSLQIGGGIGQSVVSAGVGPGGTTAGGYAAFMDTSDNVEASGYSEIKRLTLRGGFIGNADDNAFLADSLIDAKFADFAEAAGATVEFDVDPSADPDITGATAFGTGTVAGRTLTVGAMSLMLSGPGTAYYKDSTGQVSLFGTTKQSSLTVTNTGAVKTITIFSADDSELSGLKVQGNVKVANMTVDGPVRNLQIVTADTSATWSLPGGVGTGRVDTPADVDINVGEVRTWNMVGNYSGSFQADAVNSFRTNGIVSGLLAGRFGGFNTLIIGGNLTGDVASRGTIRSLQIAGALTGQVDVTYGDLLAVTLISASGEINVNRGLTKNVTVRSGDFDGSYRTDQGISSFKVSRGNFSGLMATCGDLGTFSVSGEMSGKAWSGGSIKTVTLGSMDGALVAASGDLDKATIRGSMTDSYLFAGFEPGDAGQLPDEQGNLAVDRWEEPTEDSQVDRARGGSIKVVNIGGNMVKSSISAGVDPGLDGFIGTYDDTVSGVGTIGKVTVCLGIYGSMSDGAAISGESYGVFAVSNTPTVKSYKQPFTYNGNATVGSMVANAVNLTVTDLKQTYNSYVITFSAPINFSTVVMSETVTLLISPTGDFDADGVNLASRLLAPVYDPVLRTLTLTLARGTWDNLRQLGMGQFIRLVLDATPEGTDGDGAITNARGRLLDGNFTGLFPSGDGTAGGDFIAPTTIGNLPDNFQQALLADPIDLELDGGTYSFTSAIVGMDNIIDIIRFNADAYEYTGVEYLGSTLVEFALFYRDTNGTASVEDDLFKAISRPVGASFDGDTYLFGEESFFQAWELPISGEYYLVLNWDNGGETYSLNITRSSSDTQLIADLGGELPGDRPIAYVSNSLSLNNNFEGYLQPKQIVYLNFSGGYATKYDTPEPVQILPFSARSLDPLLAGKESQLINGGGGATGIVSNVVSIFSEIPATQPGGSLTVNYINPSISSDWNNYLSATDGLWFTTVNPSLRGLDPETDFTTVFIGSADERVFESGGLLGIASGVDLTNSSKADNSIVFAQNFSGYATEFDLTDMINQYSIALANAAAHELGHVLGLAHQPTDSVNYMLLADDPDNDPATPDDSNQGVGLMTYTPTITLISELSQLGTHNFEAGEFPLGTYSSVEQLLWWLA